MSFGNDRHFGDYGKILLYSLLLLEDLIKFIEQTFVQYVRFHLPRAICTQFYDFLNGMHTVCREFKKKHWDHLTNSRYRTV